MRHPERASVYYDRKREGYENEAIVPTNDPALWTVWAEDKRIGCVYATAEGWMALGGGLFASRGPHGERGAVWAVNYPSKEQAADCLLKARLHKMGRIYPSGWPVGNGENTGPWRPGHICPSGPHTEES